jgi:phage I-like protein
MKNILNGLLAAHAIAALEAGQTTPPTEFRIWKQGLNTISDGRPPLLFDEAAAKEVMEVYASRNMDVVSDYEHQAIAKPPIKAPAAGWFGLELRDGELWAVNVRWTEAAANHIKAAEYRFYSPTFFYEEVKVDGVTAWRPWFLLTVSLTNVPAMEQLDPLGAARLAGHRTADRRTVGAHNLNLSFGEIRSALWDALNHAFPDDWPYIEAVYNSEVVFDLMDGTLYRVGYTLDGIKAVLQTPAIQVRRVYEPVEGGDVKDIIAALGLDPSASREAVLAALNAQKGLLGELQTLTGKSTLPEVLGTIRGWKAGSDQVEGLSAQLATFQAGQTEREVKELIAQALTDKKIVEGQVATLTAMGKRPRRAARVHPGDAADRHPERGPHP